MRSRPSFGVPLVLLALSSVTQAQRVFEHGPFGVTVEAYANATAAQNTGEDNTADPKRKAARIDAGLRLLGLAKTERGPKLGARLELLSSKDNTLEVGERSFLALGDWGRLEAGKRRGLPNVLTGYAPNAYTFTSAEFGLSSGRTLDPGGNLPTAFLSADLASRINAIASRGFAATLFDDRSGKLIYVSPKKAGWEGGVSFSPRAEEQGGRFKRLLQAGLVHESYFDEHVLRVGGSYSGAQGAGDVASANAFDDLRSLSGGATLVLANALYLGVSVSYDGRSGLQRVAAPASRSNGFGYATSINYNTGPWTLGAYYQQARAEGDPLRLGRDDLRAAQVGASYRLNTRVRLYAAGYVYRFLDEGGVAAGDRYSGHVVLIGTRITL
jgi:Gram-negative porin